MTAQRLDFTGIAYLAAIGVVCVVAWQVIKQGKKVGQAATDLAKKAVELVDPTSDKNIASRLANAPVEAATGGDSIGTYIASKLPSVAKNEAAIAPAATDLSDYWKQFTGTTYLNDLANQEKQLQMNNEGFAGMLKQFGYSFPKDDPRNYADTP